MKKTFVSLCCFLLILAMMAGMWGCNSEEKPPLLEPSGGDNNSGDNDDDDLFVGGDEEEDEQNQGNNEPLSGVITIEQLAKAKIVYPQDAYAPKGAVLTAVESLQAMIAQVYKVDLPLTNDRKVAGSTTYSEYEYEILIGTTNRQESSEIFKKLLLNDYGYAICGKKIIIKGGCETALIESLHKFRNNVVASKAGGRVNFYTSDLDVQVKSQYLAQDQKINGKHISEYSVVYPENSEKFEMELARRLADRMTMISGHEIKFYSDATPKTGCEILIGETNRAFNKVTATGAAVETNGSDIIAIVGSNAYDYGLAQEAFSVMIDKCVISKSDLTVAPATAATASGAIGFMAYNVYGFDYYDTRCDNIRRLVTKYLPDILAYQEPDTDMTNKIRMEDYYDWFDGKPRHTLPDGSLVADRGGANSISPILYAQDRFEFILGDTKWVTPTPDIASKLPNSSHYRMYTYAMLRDKVTGQEFIVVNWHLDFDDDIQTQSMQYMFKFFQDNYTTVPVIMLGDFNATASTNVISKVVKEQGGFTSAHEMTTNWGTTTKPASIDWIFGQTCCVQAESYAVCKETYPDKGASAASIDKQYGDHKTPSDHDAVYAKITILASEKHTHDWSEIAKAVSFSTQPSVPQPVTNQ